jgi:hypothetical protein
MAENVRRRYGEAPKEKKVKTEIAANQSSYGSAMIR